MKSIPVLRRLPVPGRCVGIPLVMILFAAASLILPCGCSLQSPMHIMTLAKIQNLRAVMCQLTQLVLVGDLPFPKTPEDIIEFMEKEGYEELKDSKDSPFEDGWGNDMRLEGDLDSYKIRSAGSDGIFDTGDDIFLIGNADWEYIVDGSKGKHISGQWLMRGSRRKPFREPNGYYCVSLPGQYTVFEDEDGLASDITFSYTPNNKVTIVADLIEDEWEPRQAMDASVEKIASGKEVMFSGFQVVDYNLIEIDNRPGYEIVMERDESLAHYYELASRDDIALSVTVISSGEDRQYIMDSLTGAIQKGLEIP